MQRDNLQTLNLGRYNNMRPVSTGDRERELNPRGHKGYRLPLILVLYRPIILPSFYITKTTPPSLRAEHPRGKYKLHNQEEQFATRELPLDLTLRMARWAKVSMPYQL